MVFHKHVYGQVVYGLYNCIFQTVIIRGFSFLGDFKFLSIIVYSYGDVTITSDGLQILTYSHHS